MTSFLTAGERAALAAAMDRVVPGDDRSPGAGSAGGADYVDQLLSAFDHDPPRIWAGDPTARQEHGSLGDHRWLELGAAEELGWRIRIEGSLGRPEREFNGAHVGWQQRYRSGLAALGENFAELDAGAQAARLASDPSFRDLVFSHACEALYGDPVHGGNRNREGWDAIGFDGPTQPTGWTDDQVTRPTSPSGGTR